MFAFPAALVVGVIGIARDRTKWAAIAVAALSAAAVVFLVFNLHLLTIPC